MKLTYRGISYEASGNGEASESGVSQRLANNSALAKKVRLRRPSHELTYRGVRYVR